MLCVEYTDKAKSQLSSLHRHDTKTVMQYVDAAKSNPEDLSYLLKLPGQKEHILLAEDHYCLVYWDKNSDELFVESINRAGEVQKALFDQCSERTPMPNTSV